MGRLDLRVVAARNLPDVQTFGKPSPYVIVTMESQKHKTGHCQSTTDPVWDEVIKFLVSDSNSAQLIFEIWNKNPVSDDFLGSYKMSLGGLVQGKVKDEWVLISQCKSNAELHIRLMPQDFGAIPPPKEAEQQHPLTQQQPQPQQPPQHNYPPMHQQPPGGYPPVPAPGGWGGGYPPQQQQYPPQPHQGYPPQPDPEMMRLRARVAELEGQNRDLMYQRDGAVQGQQRAFWERNKAISDAAGAEREKQSQLERLQRLAANQRIDHGTMQTVMGTTDKTFDEMLARIEASNDQDAKRNAMYDTIFAKEHHILNLKNDIASMSTVRIMQEEQLTEQLNRRWAAKQEENMSVIEILRMQIREMGKQPQV